MPSKDEAQKQWEEAFEDVAGRRPDDEDYNDFQQKWRHTTDFAVSQGDDPEYGTEGPGYDTGPERREWSDLLNETRGDLRERFPDEGGGGGGGGSSRSTFGSGSGGGSSTTQQWLDYIRQRDQQNAARQAELQGRNDQLWNLYMQRGQAALDPNSPVIRRASDAYSANEQRAGRDYLSDLAERSGPYANLQGEERLVNERIGQRTGNFEAQLVVDDLKQQRAEIMQYMQMAGNMLSGDQTRALQEQLGLLDAAIREQGIGLQERGLDQDWARTLLQNDQFMATLGLNAEDRAAYWDAVRRGLL